MYLLARQAVSLSAERAFISHPGERCSDGSRDVLLKEAQTVKAILKLNIDWRRRVAT